MEKSKKILPIVAGGAMLLSPLTVNATQEDDIAGLLDSAANNSVKKSQQNTPSETILFTEAIKEDLISKYTCPEELKGRKSVIEYLHDQSGDGIPDQKYTFIQSSCEDDGLDPSVLTPFIGQQISPQKLSELEEKLVIRPTENVRVRHRNEFNANGLQWECVDDLDEERIKKHLSGKGNLTITQAIAQGDGIYNFDSKPLEIIYSCKIPESIAEKIEPEKVIPLAEADQEEKVIAQSNDFYVPLMSSVGSYPSHVSFNGETAEVIAINNLGYPMGGKVNYSPAKPAETMKNSDVFESHTERLLESDLSKWVASNLFSMDFYKEFEGDLCTEEVDNGCFTKDQYIKAGSIMTQLLVDKYKSQQGNTLDTNSEENTLAKAHQTLAGYLSPGGNNGTYYYTNGTARSLSAVLSKSQNTINCNVQNYSTAKEYFDCGLAQAAQIHLSLDESIQTMYSSNSITPMNIPVPEKAMKPENMEGEK